MITIFRSPPALSCLTLPALALLAACGGPAEQSETAEEYANRIGGTAASSGQTGPSSPGQQTPAAVATTLPGAAPGPMVPNTATDPAARSCGATAVAEYLGQSDNSGVRQAITVKAQPRAGIRFIRPGEAQTRDFNNNRLNVMFDANGVIRDFRCG